MAQELKNEVKIFNSLDELMAQDASEIEEIKDETLLGLGGGMMIGDMEIPPPTAGVVMLLELIESPFITGVHDTFTLDDVFRALYVICEREKAVAPLMIERQTERKARKAFEMTSKTPEHLRVYTAFLERNRNIAGFESEVAEFAVRCGTFDPVEAAEQISDFIRLSMGGFATIPSSGDEDSKKKD